MNAIDHHLTRYLEIERLFDAFFASLNFCLTRCILPQRQRKRGGPVAACCQDRYYIWFDLNHAAFDRLREERERLYGKPIDHIRLGSVSPCEYHDPQNGCILKSHKSPTCLGFLCRRAIDHLRNEFDIYFYDYLGISYALEWILTGDLPDAEYYDLQNKIRDATARINNAGCQGRCKISERL
jgi:hypothetical protein